MSDVSFSEGCETGASDSLPIVSMTRGNVGDCRVARRWLYKNCSCAYFLFFLFFFFIFSVFLSDVGLFEMLASAEIGHTTQRDDHVRARQCGLWCCSGRRVRGMTDAGFSFRAPPLESCINLTLTHSTQHDCSWTDRCAT